MPEQLTSQSPESMQPARQPWRERATNALTPEIREELFHSGTLRVDTLEDTIYLNESVDTRVPNVKQAEEVLEPLLAFGSERILVGNTEYFATRFPSNEQLNKVKTEADPGTPLKFKALETGFIPYETYAESFSRGEIPLADTATSAETQVDAPKITMLSNSESKPLIEVTHDRQPVGHTLGWFAMPNAVGELLKEAGDSALRLQETYSASEDPEKSPVAKFSKSVDGLSGFLGAFHAKKLGITSDQYGYSQSELESSYKKLSTLMEDMDMGDPPPFEQYEQGVSEQIAKFVALRDHARSEATSSADLALAA